MRALLLAFVALLLASGCSSGGGGAPAGDTSSLMLPQGLTATVIADGFTGPTQLIDAPGGEGWWLAKLAGPEGAGEGEVVAVAPDGTTETLLTDLDKPTGIAVWRDALWIATPTAVLRATLVDGRPSEPQAVIADLPNNGRAQGTLNVLDDALVYVTTGRTSGPEPVEGSGALWRLEDPESEPQRIASGLKNAYALAALPSGDVLVTEIAEPLLDFGEPVEELNLLEEGADYGWPGCAGDGEEVIPGGCEGTVAPFVTLPPGSTPTSVVASPFDPDGVLVALWNAGEVVAVPAEGGGSATWLTGIEHPQHLLADGDALLLVDFDGGRILRIAAR
jgi:glucose/arabinose dehydrogenase